MMVPKDEELGRIGESNTEDHRAGGPFWKVGLQWSIIYMGTDVHFKSFAQCQASHTPLIQFYPNPHELSPYSSSYPPLLIAVNAPLSSQIKYGNSFVKDTGSSDAYMLM